MVTSASLIAFTGACRFASTVPCCRQRSLHALIAMENSVVTTRLAIERNIINISDLRRNNVDIIKGLYVFPTPENTCPTIQPLVIFGKPVLFGNRFDFQHIDIAKRMALSEIKKMEICGEVSYEERLQEGVLGFVLHHIDFRDNGEMSYRTQVESKKDGTQAVELKLASSDYNVIIDPSGEINRDTLLDISEETAKKLWSHSIVGYLFRNNSAKIDEIWAIRAASGISGSFFKFLQKNKYTKEAAEGFINQFLYSLAKHVSPDFLVFSFYEEKGVYSPHIINVSWEETVFPNCLLWPKELRLIIEDFRSFSA